MNRELKRMLQLAGGLLAGALVIINLGALFQRPPAGIPATTAGWRIHERRIRRFNPRRPSERGGYPQLQRGPVALVANQHAHRIYLLQGKRVAYIFNATVRRPAGTTVMLGSQRGRRLYQLRGNHTTTNGSWLTAGPTAYLAAFEAQPPAGSVQVSDPDATWLVHHLPAGTRLVVK